MRALEEHERPWVSPAQALAACVSQLGPEATEAFVRIVRVAIRRYQDATMAAHALTSLEPAHSVRLTGGHLVLLLVAARALRVRDIDQHENERKGWDERLRRARKNWRIAGPGILTPRDALGTYRSWKRDAERPPETRDRDWYRRQAQHEVFLIDQAMLLGNTRRASEIFRRLQRLRLDVHPAWRHRGCRNDRTARSRSR